VRSLLRYFDAFGHQQSFFRLLVNTAAVHTQCELPLYIAMPKCPNAQMLKLHCNLVRAQRAAPSSTTRTANPSASNGCCIAISGNSDSQSKFMHGFGGI
jgi:hypothetical protein